MIKYTPDGKLSSGVYFNRVNIYIPIPSFPLQFVFSAKVVLLCKAFRRNTGMSPMKYRMKKLASPVCEQVSDAWPSVRKGLVDRGYRGVLIENIKRDFNIDIEVCSTPNGTNGFLIMSNIKFYLNSNTL